MTSLDVLLQKMEDWDRISHCITELNQSRALAEAETVKAIDHILKAVEECKRSLTEKQSGDRCMEDLGKLLEAAEQVEVVSKKRDESVRSNASRLKRAVDAALLVEEEEASKEETEKGAQEKSPDEVDPQSLGLGPATKRESELIDRALIWHFLYEGFLDTAQVFAKEAELSPIPESELNRVKTGLEAAAAMLKHKDLSLAIAWLEEHASPSSNLLFDLHRLRFLQLATSQTEAFSYAQRNFARFATSRSQEIQTLLGGLLFRSSSSSPAVSSGHQATTGGDEKAWDQAHHALLGEIRRSYGSMSVLISTGLRALPELRTYQRLVAPESRITRKTWIEKQELPVQVDSQTHYHSEFLCPVSQEQTDSTTNPPMLLACGHVVAKNSIVRIAKGRQRFKCPTCPTEQSVEAPTPIYF